MATHALASYVTMLEMLKHDGMDGRLLPLINSLAQRIDILKVAHVMEANDGTGHEGVREFSHPTGSWRAYNEGIAAEASFSEPYREPCAMLDGKWHADLALLMHSKNPGEKRLRMIGQYIAGMMKTFATAVLYGERSADGKRINGITARAAYNTLSSARVHDNAAGDASVTANKTSIYLMGFGEEKCSIIYPNNDAPGQIDGSYPDPNVQGMGVKVVALPDGYVTDIGGTNEFLAARNYLMLHFGFVVNDERYLQRQCNISTSNIDGVDDFSFDENVMIDMLTAMPDLDNAAMFCNKTISAQLRKRVNEKGNIFHTIDTPFGKNVLAVDNVPILQMAPSDTGLSGGIVNTEATVT